MNTPKAPWLKYFGDMPAHLDYPTGSMYEAVKESAKTKKKIKTNKTLKTETGNKPTQLRFRTDGTERKEKWQ